MDSTQKLVEKLVERRMRVTGESQAVATANVMAAFEKLKKKLEKLEHSIPGNHLGQINTRLRIPCIILTKDLL